MDSTEIAAALNSQQSSEYAEPTPTFSTNQKLVAQLWTRMAGLYGQQWTGGHGDKDDGTWASGLTGLSGADFARGLRACVETGESWPPSLPKFRAWCKEPGSGHAPITRALPEPPSVGERRKATAQHWHHMWVMSGLEPLSSLKGEALDLFVTKYGKGPFEPWGDERIQAYCTQATSNIAHGAPLPELKQ